MGQILVRNLDDQVVAKLKERAKDHGRSLAAEVRIILQQAADERKLDMATARRRIEEVRARFKGRTLPDSLEIIREGRNR